MSNFEVKSSTFAQRNSVFAPHRASSSTLQQVRKSLGIIWRSHNITSFKRNHTFESLIVFTLKIKLNECKRNMRKNTTTTRWNIHMKERHTKKGPLSTINLLLHEEVLSPLLYINSDKLSVMCHKKKEEENKKTRKNINTNQTKKKKIHLFVSLS